MYKREFPESWFVPRAVLDDDGNVLLDVIDDDLDNYYENGKGVLIPVASQDGNVLSEKKQKQILRHFISDFSRAKFNMMIGVLRSSAEETTEQIIRWGNMLKRVTGEERSDLALERVHVMGFAVCAPRRAQDDEVTWKTFVEALELGLPTAIYHVPDLSKAEINPEMIRNLVEQYDNLLLVIDKDGVSHNPEGFACNPSEIEDEPAIEIETIIEDESVIAIETIIEDEPAIEIEQSESPIKVINLALPDKFAGREVTALPLDSLITAEENEEQPPESQSLMGKLKEVPKNKSLKRVIAVELISFLLLAFGVYDTVQVQAMVKRSEAIATESASSFVSKATPLVVDSQKQADKAAKDAIKQAKIDRLRSAAANLEYIPEENVDDIESSDVYQLVQGAYSWDGAVISTRAGAVTGPNGRETYYNLNMSGVVNVMRGMGNTDTYWVRSDGCKMLGNYIMVAANLDVHPRGSIVKSSRGLAIVCDTGGFAANNPQQLDIATAW